MVMGGHVMTAMEGLLTTVMEAQQTIAMVGQLTVAMEALVTQVMEVQHILGMEALVTRAMEALVMKDTGEGLTVQHTVAYVKNSMSSIRDR